MPLHFSGRILGALLLVGTLLTGCDNSDKTAIQSKLA